MRKHPEKSKKIKAFINKYYWEGKIINQKKMIGRNLRK